MNYFHKGNLNKQARVLKHRGGKVGERQCVQRDQNRKTVMKTAV